MKRSLLFLIALATVWAAAQTAGGRGAKAAAGSGTAIDAEIRAHLLDFLNRTVGWQNLDKVEVKSISAPDASGIRTVVVHLAKGEQQQDATYYVTADGKEIIEGELSKLSGDPWATTRAKLATEGAPSEGAAAAPVTIVEFSDLECPYCKELAATLAQLMEQEPGKVRVIFKYFPLTTIHPWSLQAAEAAVCVAEQNPPDFWNFANLVFTHQDEITAENAPQRLRDYALESGAQAGAFQGCVSSPATAAKVEASIANGKAVGVTTTPTMFIDGRMIPGAVDLDQLKKLIDHEAAVGPSLTGKVAGQTCSECKPLSPIIHHP